MTTAEVRPLVGATVTVVTEQCALHGRLLSCTARSLWLIDDGELDVVVPLQQVVLVHRDAA